RISARSKNLIAFFGKIFANGFTNPRGTAGNEYCFWHRWLLKSKGREKRKEKKEKRRRILEFWNLEFGIWNLGFGIWDLEFGIWNFLFPKFREQKMASYLHHTATTI